MRRFFWIAALTVIVDQLTKWACTRLTDSVILMPGVLALTYAENTVTIRSALNAQSEAALDALARELCGK